MAEFFDDDIQNKLIHFLFPIKVKFTNIIFLILLQNGSQLKIDPLNLREIKVQYQAMFSVNYSFYFGFFEYFNRVVQ